SPNSESSRSCRELHPVCEGNGPLQIDLCLFERGRESRRLPLSLVALLRCESSNQFSYPTRKIPERNLASVKAPHNLLVDAHARECHTQFAVVSNKRALGPNAERKEVGQAFIN